jgi:hypothetical protein
MLHELLTLTNSIVAATDELLTQATITDLQRKFALSIASEAKELHSLIVTIPDGAIEQAKQMLSFDGRSHLTSIIGYAEVLLDEVEGELTDHQSDLLYEIQANGKQLLVQISELAKS